MNRIKVFYDGSCPACDKAMEKYKQLSRSEEIDWLDISQDASVLEPYHIRLSDEVSKLHLIDKNGQTKIGAESFVIIWEQLAYYRFFAYFCRLFRLLPLMDWVYSACRSSTEHQCNEEDCH